MTQLSESPREAQQQINPIFNAKSITRVATWNVRTLYQCGRLSQALKQMRDYRIDILGVSETRWTGQGRFTSEDFTVLHSGREELHYQGVGIIMHKNSAKSLIGWKPVNERIITARFQTKHAKVTVVQVYAPTETSPVEEKDAFYEQLQTTLDDVSSYDVKLLLGDFNAKIGPDRSGSETVIGPHGSAQNTNDNGERMTMMCSANGLYVGNTLFKHKRIHKMTWTSPDGNTQNEIDYVCVNRRWRSSLLDVRAYRGADVGSDHNLVTAKIRIKLTRVKRSQATRPFALPALKDPEIADCYRIEVSNRFAALQDSENLIEQWEAFQEVVKDSADTIVGRRRGSYKERWISDHTWELIDRRKQSKITRDQTRTRAQWQRMDAEYKLADKAVKKSCRNDKKTWIEDKGREAEEAAGKNDSKTLYRIVRELTGISSNSSVPLKSKQGETLLTEREQAARWVEHFNEVLNQPISDDLFDYSKEDVIGTINVSLSDIDEDEISKAVNKLKKNKAAGLDGIPAELLQYGGEAVVKELSQLFNTIWHTEDVPNEWRQGVIVPLPKKGCLSDCNNWRGITLLSVPGKVFCSVLLNRLQKEVDALLREEQAGFRAGRSCSEQILTLRNILEQCHNWQKPLHINYIDFKKAFDSIHRDSLWKILELYGIPSKYINIFKALYRDSSCCVRTREGNTEMFSILTGVRQGCILSPFLFLIVMDFVMRKTTDGHDFGIVWGQKKLADLDFADDLALLCHTQQALQDMTNRLHVCGKKVGLRISGEKTKVMTVGARTTSPITLEGQNIEKVDKFQYLGSYLSENGDVEVDIRARLGKASSVFQRLRPIWKCSTIKEDVKLRLYSSIVVPTGIYASETWKTTNKINKMIDVFHRRCLRSILGISWRDHITNDEVMARSEQMALHDTVAIRRRRFVGHILRLPTTRPASLLSGIRIDTRKWQEEGRKTKEDMARHTERRFGHTGC